MKYYINIKLDDEMEKTILTSQLITEKNVTSIYEKYKNNWSREGIHKNAISYYSESGEDGICESIFSVIGLKSKYFVEFGAWDGLHLSNSAYFRIKHGWDGLLLDGGFENLEINLHKHYLTSENINDLFHRYGTPEEFDLLSVDIDGNDYWILREILKKFKPRVMVLETNQLISPEISATVEYNPNIYWDVNDRYFGASARAWDNLGKKHGYTMVGMHDQNVFLVQNSDALKLASAIDGFGDIEKLFKPRIPRWYVDNNEIIEHSKEEVHDIAVSGRDIKLGTPLIERTMKNFVKDGLWVIL